MNYLHSIGINNIYNHNMELAANIIEDISGIDGITVISKCDSPIISFKHDTISANEIVNRLSEVYIKVTNRGGYVRISPHLYNNYSGHKKSY